MEREGNGREGRKGRRRGGKKPLKVQGRGKELQEGSGCGNGEEVRVWEGPLRVLTGLTGHWKQGNWDHSWAPALSN